jgi:hypothetical protein
MIFLPKSVVPAHSLALLAPRQIIFTGARSCVHDIANTRTGARNSCVG